MKEIWLVSVREMKTVFGNRRTLISVITFIVAWGFISVPRLMSRLGSVGGFGNTLFYLSTLMCVYTGFVLSARSFLGEKRDSRIGTLLSTPLTVQKIWLGKVIGIVIPSFGIGILVTAAAGFLLSIWQKTGFIPQAPLILYFFFVLPLLLAAFLGLLGYLQLLLGMRENRIVNIIVMIVLFGGLGLTNSLAGGGGFVHWPVVGIIFGAALLLLVLLSYIVRFIKVERIITSLE